MAHIISKAYGELGYSETFNRGHHNIIPTGFYTDVTLTKISDVLVEVSTFTAFMKDSTLDLSIRIENDATEQVAISDTDNYIVVRITWVNNVANDYEITNVAVGDILSTDLVIGKGNFTLTTLDSLDYIEQTTSPLKNLSSVNDSFSIDTNTLITDTTASTSTSTGCLVLDGGLGLGGNIWCDGTINSLNNNITGHDLISLASISAGDASASDGTLSLYDTSSNLNTFFSATTTDTNWINGYLAINTNYDGKTSPSPLYIEGEINATPFSIALPTGTLLCLREDNSTTSASSISLIGGTEGSNAIYFGTISDYNLGTLSYSNFFETMTFRVGDVNTMTLNATDGLEISKPITITDTTQSTSKDTGCLIIDGGLGVEKDIWLDGDLSKSGTFNINASGSNELNLQTNSMDRLIISSGGRASFNTTSANAQVNIKKDTIGEVLRIFTDDHDVDDYFNFALQGTAISPELRINQVDAGTTYNSITLKSGFVGIRNITPTTTIDINGSFSGKLNEITTNTYNSLDTTDEFAFQANTLSGDITINGFSNGQSGQVIYIYKPSSSNNLIINHNNASGTQKIINPGGVNVTYATYGFVKLICNGTFWYSDAV